MRGHLTIFYPRGSTARWREKIDVEVIVIRAPLRDRDDDIGSADAHAAEATIRLRDGNVLTVPFNDITIPQYVSTSAYVLQARFEVASLVDPKLGRLHAIIGKQPEMQWGGGWGDGPLTWRSTFVAKDEAAAEAWKKAVHEKMPDVETFVLLASAPVPTIAFW